MLPVLIGIGPFKLYTYAVALLAGLIAFFFVIWKRGRELHFDEDTLLEAVLIIGFWTVIGARLAYVFLVQWGQFGFNLAKWAALVKAPGLWYPAMLLVGAGVVWWQAKLRRWDFWSLTDVLLTAFCCLQIFLAWGRFFNGSGYGIAANNFLGLRFGGLLDKHLPVQLIEAVGYWLLYYWLTYLENHYRTFGWYKGSRSEAQSGFVTAVYLMAAGMFELVLTPVKLPLAVWFGLRVDALAAFGIFLAGVFVLYHRSALSLPRRYREWNDQRNRLTKSSVQNMTDDNRWSRDIFN